MSPRPNPNSNPIPLVPVATSPGVEEQTPVGVVSGPVERSFPHRCRTSQGRTWSMASSDRDEFAQRARRLTTALGPHVAVLLATFSNRCASTDSTPFIERSLIS
jgi:hypothetical protein